MDYQKIKSVAKSVRTKSPELTTLVHNTMRTIADIVGGTLGPGGRPVLIERGEQLPAAVTKDGVTVFRSLGFTDPTAHVVMEAARDASVRTANEAGDGPQPLWSKVLTPRGFVPMGSLEVGMDICGTQGTVQKVVGVFPKGEKPLVEVAFEGGKKVFCCEDHLWEVTTSYGAQKILTTREMAKDFKSEDGDGNIRYRYYTPRTHVDFNSSAQLALPPYLVGVLLGDGSLTDSGSVELSLGIKKQHIIEKIEKLLPKGLTMLVSSVPEKHSVRVKINGRTPDGKSIRDFLEQIGLRNTDSWTKKIPDAYLFASLGDRARLLHGLIDTDGHVNARGRFEFSTVSDALADNFAFLTSSLGYSVYRTLHTRENDVGAYSSSPIHRFIELKGNKYGDKIVDIRLTGRTEEMRCIKVSNLDNLYITDDFVVTHNTTTATILSEAIVRHMDRYCKANPHVSPQKVVRRLETAFRDFLMPEILKQSIPCDFINNKKNLHAVATISANGDVELADAVMKCFDIVGDEGNVTLLEVSGPSHYEVEQIRGYALGIGYEDSCAKYYSKFINDPGTMRVVLDKPGFIVYNGRITDIQSIVMLLEKIGMEWQQNGFNHNIVLMATGFSETVLAQLALNFSEPGTINVFPLLCPQSPIANGQTDILEDVAALSDAAILDPINNPVEEADIDCIGLGCNQFEASRFRSAIIGMADEDLLTSRVADLKARVNSTESLLEKRLVEERIGKLTGGIAKLKVVGSSSGELREKRDRAEDAVCAVRGAIKHGCLPGGGWTLIHLAKRLLTLNDEILNNVLVPALYSPVHVLLENVGLSGEEEQAIIARLESDLGSKTVYDALRGIFVNAVDGGVLDSTPAVLEALRNSLSIASLLGTLGGTVVYYRDSQLERQEASDTASFLRHAAEGNPADERG